MKIEPKKFPSTPLKIDWLVGPLKGLPKTLFEKALSQSAMAEVTFGKVRFLNINFNYEGIVKKYDFYDSVCKHTIFCE